MREKLTARQEIFAAHYALHGNGTRAAIAAGTSIRSAHTRAYKWVKKAAIQRRIEKLRAAAFRELRERIVRGLAEAILLGLERGICFKEAHRAIRLLERLGVFPGERKAEPSPKAEVSPFAAMSEEELRQLMELAHTGPTGTQDSP